jgi:AraC-like DNA-binding protein
LSSIHHPQPPHTESAAGSFRFRTADPDEMVAAAASISGGTVTVEALGRDFLAEMHVERLASAALFCPSLRSCRLVAPPGRHFVSLSFPLTGVSELVDSDGLETLVPGSAHILATDLPFDFRVPRESSMLVANFLRPDLLGAFNGPRVLDLRDPRVSAFWRFLSYTWQELRASNGLSESSFPVQRLEECLTQMAGDLVESIGTSHPGGDGRAMRRVVTRATEFMLAHIGSRLTLAAVSEAAGVSNSTLLRAFRSVHGLSPMQFLRRRRLDMVRERLRRAVPGETTVTEVATEFGFEHLGRFAVDYRAAFGESPSTTLKS